MLNKFQIHAPRLVACSVAAAVLVTALALISPVQLPVLLYKLAQVLLACYAGYWIDRWLFPYARPDGYLAREWRAHDGLYPDDEADHAVVPGYQLIFASALLRRALIVTGCMLAVCLGL
ncbi:phage-related membrane protein [Desulfovibrio sp. DV]|uniref:putative holin n=1 Tax=Desulfovibrio sp. DV TaxID=1844708 RepID=UPI00094BBC04|nr:putative holin [Desulfovibrio sp. DV]OLN30429.1 phage-related membrane protein [Desulfovibrio sp. DV]